ncbi:MAG: phage tail tape measure protein [Lutibacter sp.]
MAIDKNKEFTKGIIELNNASKQIKNATNNSEYVKAKTKEIEISKKQGVIWKEQIQLENQLISAIKKKQLALESTSSALIKERVELQLRNKQTKEAAILSSKLSSEYAKLVIKMNQAASSIQSLIAKKLQGIELSNKEQQELKESQLQFAKYQRAVLGADASVGRFQRNVGNYPKALGAAANAVRSLASAMGLMSAAFLFVSVMRSALRTIVEFDRQLIAVGKTTGIVGQDLKDFGTKVIQLGIQLKGISTKDLLKASEIAGQLGIKGSDNILKFSTTIEKLRLTSNIAGEESARAFAKFIEVSSDSVENADKLGSVITQLGNNFATTESEILKNTTEIQKGIAIYATSAQGVLALGAATNALGGEAEASRGAMQRTFRTLNEAATEGKNLEKILKLTGQTAAEFKEEFGRDAIAVFDKFVKGLSLSAKEGKNLSSTLTELGLDELRVSAVVGSLATNYETLERALAMANEEYINNTALNKEAAMASESLSSHIGDLGDAWDNLVLNVEKGNGAISKFFKNIVTGTTKMVTLMDSISEISTGFWSFASNLYRSTQLGGAASIVLDAEIKRIQNERISLATELVDLLDKQAKTYGTGIDKEQEMATQLNKTTEQIKSHIAELKEKKKVVGELSEEEQKAIDEDEKNRKKQNNYIKGSIGYLNEMIAANNALIDQATDRGTIEKLQKENELLGIQKELLLQGLRAKAETVKATQAGSNGSIVDQTLPGTTLEQDKVSVNDFSLIMSDTEDFLKNYESQIQTGIDLTNTFFDARIQRIDEDIQKSEEYYNKQLQLAGDDEIQKDLITNQAEIAREKLEAKKRKELQKQAVFNKAIAISEIAINTAIAISKVAAQTGIFALAGIGPIILLGALQTATVLAQPIPKYKMGRKGGLEEIAITGDGGVREVITDKFGNNPRLTPSTPTLTFLNEGDKVHSSVEDYYKLQRAAMMSSITMEGRKTSDFQTKQYFDDSLDKERLGIMKETLKAIQRQKTIILKNKIDIPHSMWKSKNTN